MIYTSVCRFLLGLMICLSLISLSYAAQPRLSLELQNANLSDAIGVIAKFIHINVIISPAVNGVATLNLQNAIPEQALDLLLTSHGLSKWQVGNVWFIAPRDELIKRKQEELKWQQAWDESATIVTHFWQIQYGKAEEIARLLQNEHTSLLSKRGRVLFDARTNIICVQDIAEKMEKARQLIKHLDVPVQQIAIHARLASVDNDFERELGIDFSVKAQAEGKGDGARAMLPPSGYYSIAVAKLADGSLLDVKLAALENAGHAELISSPSLFTADQQPASIEAGEEVPYQEVSESGGTAVVFKKAVLGLKVTPQVLPGKKVLLQLQINQDRPSNRLVLGVPTISTRQMMTNVLVRSGETIVLGGIYETNRESGQKRLPFISKIPLIGWLFKQQNTRENKRELLIFVTPNIIM